MTFVIGWIKRNRTRALLWGISALLAIAGFVLLAVFYNLDNGLVGQTVAEQFRGESEMNFVQATAFFPVGAEGDFLQVNSMRDSMEGSLSDSGLEQPEKGSLWMDAFSGTTTVSVASERTSTSVTATTVGGDWFYFHPMYLRDGQYIEEDDLMHDRVVITEELAWRLFGSIEVAGMSFFIGDEPFIVAGVVSYPDNFAEQDLRDEQGGLYMHYDRAVELTGESAISSYELVCAEPITGFTESLLTNTFASGAETASPWDAVVVRNTDRFTFWDSVVRITAVDERAVVESAVTYPAWENAARVVEDWGKVVLSFCIAAFLFPTLLLIIYFIKLCVKIKRAFAERIPEWQERTSDKIRAKQRARIERREAK